MARPTGGAAANVRGPHGAPSWRSPVTARLSLGLVLTHSGPRTPGARPRAREWLEAFAASLTVAEVQFVDAERPAVEGRVRLTVINGSAADLR